MLFLNQKEENNQFEQPLDYLQLINYMKELRKFFLKAYKTQFKLGKIYQENANYSYVSLTTEGLKKHKLKFVIILNHKELCFSICLSGQNKAVRKKYWNILKNRNHNNYHLAESIDDSLSIIEKLIVDQPDFSDKENLTQEVEEKSLKFIAEINGLLEV